MDDDYVPVGQRKISIRKLVLLGLTAVLILSCAYFYKIDD